MNNLASTYRAQGKTKKALNLQEEALEKSMQILGPNHSTTILVRNDLALRYRREGRAEEAETLQNDLLDRSTAILGRTHQTTMRIANDMHSVFPKDRLLIKRRDVKTPYDPDNNHSG